MPKSPETIPNDSPPQIICGQTPGKRSSNFLWKQVQPLTRRREEGAKKQQTAASKDATGSCCSPSTISLFSAASSCSALFSLQRESIHFRSFNPEEEASFPGHSGDGRIMWLRPFSTPPHSSLPPPCLGRAAAINS